MPTQKRSFTSAMFRFLLVCFTVLIFCSSSPKQTGNVVGQESSHDLIRGKSPLKIRHQKQNATYLPSLQNGENTFFNPRREKSHIKFSQKRFSDGMYIVTCFSLCINLTTFYVMNVNLILFWLVCFLCVFLAIALNST